MRWEDEEIPSEDEDQVLGCEFESGRWAEGVGEDSRVGYRQRSSERQRWPNVS